MSQLLIPPSSVVVLGSRSPRRRELLELLIPAASMVVLPPRSHEEPGFEDVDDWPGVENRLLQIARLKADDVLDQCAASRPAARFIVLCADTTIVAQQGDRLIVLGQPPEVPEWRTTVREWFERCYLGQTHWALTALCVVCPDAGGRRLEQVVRTAVTFGCCESAILDWYLDTGESLGKAGGYALQGAASMFVDRIEGSPSNVVGLPLRETRSLLQQAWN